jgi:hypothetical protein
MKTICIVLLMIIAIKSIFIGSEFNFYKWIKGGKKYFKQYEDWLNIKP